ncbi:MAG: His/Gly/Thr/Pro-type tRNA ligase C-terminal domain-containing protein, partial [Smithellaceae bacterium]
GIAAAMDYSDKSLKSQMKRADKLNSSYTLIFGDKEIDEKSVELRNMNTKIQQVLPLDNLRDAIINIIQKR